MTPENVTPSVSTFTDEIARTWEVREICQPIISHPRAPVTRPEYANGWLLFTSGPERRRFAPLPPGWRVAGPELLRRWCRDAIPADREPD